MAYITPSPQRRPLFILSTLILIALGSSFLNPLASQATIGRMNVLPHELASSSSDSGLIRQVPYRKTELTIDERTDSDIQKYSFITKYHDAEHLPSTLVLVATKDDSSWGHSEGEANRTFTDFLDMVIRQRVPPQDISIGLLTANRESLDRYSTILLSNDLPIASVEILYAPKTNFQVGPDAADRSFQLRNLLMKEAVKKQEHIVWIDPDIFELPEGLFDRFYKVSESGIDELQIANVPNGKGSKLLPLGITTVMCHQTSYRDMVRNGYSGPSEAEMKKWQEDRKPLKAWPKPMSHIVENTSDGTLVRLDGVGETVLYIRADLIRKGLKWPHGEKSNSEGLCSLAKDMGWGCYGLGGGWETRHTDTLDIVAA
ncbi:uncharacterized protein DFL_001535 [Arthrobotrys flagrans]|uniref:Uncharacterized protein n=1 Tax=Arthrobotrys flagrans TaxID=97331 RepID=A0A437A7V5_ARTFL|nr:hypothetical protein DFL_001535 [Arthrobotrys flagrans]